MIVAFLNQKGGVGKTTLALHLAGAWSARGRRVLVVDADPQASALDWADQRLREGLPLAPWDRKTFYGGAAEGYTDYPALP